MGAFSSKIHHIELVEAMRVKNDTAASKLLKEFKINPNKIVQGNHTVLEQASKWGRVSVVRELLDSKVTIPPYSLDKSLLCCCAEETNAEVAELLMEAGADPNCHDQYGDTPLINCCRKATDTSADMLREKRKVALMLIRKNVDLNARNMDKLSGIQVACRDEHEKMALMLIKEGCDIKEVVSWINHHKNNAKNWVANSVLKHHAFESKEFVQKLQQQWMSTFDDDGNGNLGKEEFIQFLAAHVKYAFKAGLTPTDKFTDDGSLELDQIASLLQSRCPDMIKAYEKSLDTDNDGTYSWEELLPIVKDFYSNLWSANRPETVPEEGEDVTEEDIFVLAKKNNSQPEDDKEKVAQKPLPEGWSEVKNPNSTGDHDAVYYANSKTNETRWERPT